MKDLAEAESQRAGADTIQDGRVDSGCGEGWGHCGERGAHLGWARPSQLIHSLLLGSLTFTVRKVRDYSGVSVNTVNRIWANL